MKNFGISLLKRIISTIITLFLLSSLIFILLRIAPGDPIQKFVSPELSPLLADKIRKSFLLDKSLFEQYFIFIKNIFLGDFGISYNYRTSVVAVISNALPFTLIFSSISFIIQVLISLSLIFFISKRRGTFIDHLLSKVNLILYAVPSMIIGMGLIYLFSIQLNLFPSSDLHTLDFENFTFVERLLDYTLHMILPLVTLSLPGIIVFYSYLRGSIEETYHKNFILFLRASGMNEKILFKNHVLPNSIEPFISILGTELGILLCGTIITEVIFGLPGMGRLTVTAILSRDYPLVVGCVFASAVLVILANLFSDFSKVIINKRLRTEYF